MSSLNFAQIRPFLRRHPAFARVYLADVLSQLGQGMLLVALPMLLLEATGRVEYSGLTFSGEIVAYGLLSPLAGYWADRLEQKLLMVGANLGRMLLLGALLAVLAAHGPLWAYLLLSTLVGAVGAVFVPARAAFLRRLLSGDDLLAAVALEGTTGFLLRLVAPALMAVVLTVYPASAGLGLNLAIYAVSTAMLGPSWVSGPRLCPPPGREGSWREGWTLILSSPTLRTLLSLDVLLSTVGMAAWSTTVAFLQVVLGQPASANGWLVAATGLAGAVGTRLGPRLGVRRRGLVALVAVIAFTYLSIPWVHGLAGLVALWLLRGLAIGVFVVLFAQQIARETPPERMGRVQAAWDLAVCIAAFSGSASTPWLLTHLGPARSFELFGLLATAVAVLLARRLSL